MKHQLHLIAVDLEADPWLWFGGFDRFARWVACWT